MKKIAVLFATLTILCACSQKSDNLSPLTITTDNGDITYNIETAISDEELQTGLMNRDKLDSKSGMIFDLSRHQDRPATMWMKDTKIPLDIIFIDNDNKIFWIYEKATPMSEEIIAAPAPAKAVLEINSGDVEKHQIQIGQTVSHSLLNTKAKKTEK